jgi:ubiquinone/menaquinone biosynthesis C-methylase UbiE
LGYFDWHEQPGYWRDVTRHFEPGVNLLDVGCGTGWLADHFEHYTGIDGSPDAVAEAVKRGRNVGQGDLAQGLPFEDASFQAVIVKDVLEHVLEPAALVTEIRRVLATRSAGCGTTTRTCVRSRCAASAACSPTTASSWTAPATSPSCRASGSCPG